jgi:phosphatidylinositol alpha-mannosyltransferase
MAAPGMRIALTNPFCWPLVRRGSERLLNDLSLDLARRGHEVTVISSEPGPRRVEQSGGVTRILLPQRQPLGIPNRWLNLLHHFGWGVRREVLRGRFDAVFALNYHDAYGVLSARASGLRCRLTYMMAGIASRRYFRTIPHDGLMFRAVLRRAETVLSVSRMAQRNLLDEFGQSSLLLPAPTDTAAYAAAPRPAQDGTLRLLFVADADEPRKGAVVLARAFHRVRSSRPDARLSYSGHASEATIATVRAAVPPETAAAIDFLGPGQVGDLPALYARASVMVNPAVWEAQGMVFVEALAAGTPVVGCDHGGVPDIVSDRRIGRLFSPGAIVDRAASDDAALAQAILEASALAACAQTAARCRAHAERFGWARLGDEFEAVITGARKEGCAGAPAWRMEASCALPRTGTGTDRPTSTGTA